MHQFKFQTIESWPVLAWLAVCRKSADIIDVLHGTNVEERGDWFCEAVWNGRFEDGDFDSTDAVFGTGGRIRAGGVIFVSSGSPLERLHSIEIQGQVVISNSLACLLRFCEARVNVNYTRYILDFDTIAKGIENYKTTLETSAGPVRLTYFNNLRWDGNSLQEMKKPGERRDFGTFAKYRQFLDESLRGLSENMAAAARKTHFSMIATMSSGYDSATASALAKPFGLEEAISFDTARGGKIDSGERIAAALGIKLHILRRDAWRGRRAEALFLATQASGGDVFLAGAEEFLSNRVLLTGYHGDKVWGTKLWNGADTLARGNASGTGVSEYRLSRCFIQVPLPFLGARQSSDIVKLTGTAEMDPWRLSNSYDRPICRRILEQAGVPRDAFGMRKGATSVIFWQRGDFISDDSAKQCANFLKAKGVHVRTLSSTLADILAPTIFFAGRVMAFISARVLRGRFSKLSSIATRAKEIGRGSDPLSRSKWMPLTTRDRMFQYIFPWSIDCAMKQYDGSPRLADLEHFLISPK